MATESFIEKRKRELREKNGGSTESASSFVERRKKELSGEIKTPEAQMSSKVLQDTLSSVLKPNVSVSPSTTSATVQQKPQSTQKTVDFKADQAAQKAKQSQVVSPLQGKLPAADLLTGKLNNSVQETLKDKVPAATLVNQTGGGPANASQIPGISQYETTKKEIANDNAPAAVKAYANVMNYATQGNPIGQAITRSFQGNSGVTSRDTTGNKTVDKITDVINDVVTPFITPTGAPVGQGIIGSTYDATGKALSGKAGQTLLKGAEKIIPGSQNTVRVAATEGIAGAMQGAEFGLQQGQDSGNEIARNALYGAAAGGVLGGAGAAIGEVLPKLFRRGPSGRPVEVNAADDGINFAEYQGEPMANEMPVPVTREQEIYRKYMNDQPITQEEMDFMLGPDWNEANLIIKTPAVSEQNTVIPKAKIPEVAATAEVTPVKATVPKAEPKPITTEVTPVNQVETTPKKKYKQGERGFAETLNRSDKTPDGFAEKLDTKYEPTTNRGDLEKAEDRIKDREGATRFVLEDKKGGLTSEQSITAQRLIDTHLKEGNVKAAEEVADALLKESTRSAQFLQSLSAYNKLSPEGVYMVAKRMANKVNETSSKLARKAEVTPQMADDIVGLATLNQKMTGVKDLSNDVVNILKRAKDGEMLSDVETSMLTKFVDESKQFIKETSKKPILDQPKLPKDKKVRDSVSKFLDKQEEAAKARLRAKGMRFSSTPIDIWADYAVIGAAKMGRGIVKFADWSEQMVKDLGEDIQPYLNNLYEKSTEAFNLSSKKVSAKSVSAAEKLTQKVIKTKELSEQEADSLLRLVSQVDNLSGEEKRVASQDLQVILQSLDNPSIGKKISSIQTQAQLLNPKTQVRNVVGNELFYRLERISKYVSTPIDIARSKLTGSKRQVTFRTHNQGKYWENFINGGSAGWRGVNINGIETQYDLASPAFKSKYNPLRYTEKALGAALRSFDNAAYSRAMNKTLGELGTLDAINNGVKPSKEYIQDFIRNADENIMKIAQDYGKYVTFQDNNLISQGLTKFKRGLNLGKDFGVGDLIIKYPKTPGALLMRALEYSPAGFLRSAKIAAEPLLRNGVEKNPAEAVQALSRAIIGTGGLSMLGYYLMDKDILTGAASTDKDIRSLQSAAGKGAYQVNLSALYRFVKSGFDDKEAKIKENDLMYNYDWMQPLSIAISLGANVKGNEGKDSSKIATGLVGAAYNSVSGALNTLSEQSVLQGVESALSGYTGQTTTDKLVSMVADMPASFIPTLSNQIKQTTDNTKRETMGTDIVEQTKNKVKAKIPGVAETLPKKYNTLGEEQTHYQDNNAFNIYANPGFPSRYKLSPEARKVVDLIAATGDETLAPRVPGKTVNGMKLTGKEYSRYSQLQGEETKSLIAELDATMSIQDQADEMEKILRDASKTAKEKLLLEFPRLEKSDD